MISRVYTGPDGKSHFEDLEQPPGTGDNKPQKAQVMFQLRPPGFFQDFHTPAKTTYVITLTGATVVKAEDGDTRRFGPGDILLAEDKTGKGHSSQTLEGDPRLYLAIILDE